MKPVLMEVDMLDMSEFDQKQAMHFLYVIESTESFKTTPHCQPEGRHDAIANAGVLVCL